MKRIENETFFFELQSQLEQRSFLESRGWYLSQTNSKIHFFVDDDQHPSIAVWGREFKIPLFGKKLLLIYGEALSSDINEKKIRAFYSDLIELEFFGIEINSSNTYSTEYEIGLRRAGFIRPIGSFSCPLTIVNKLQEEPNFNRNWKRNVKKAEKSGLFFKEIQEVDEKIIDSFIRLFQELADLKGLNYKLEEKSLSKLLSSTDMRLFFVYSKGNKPLAARIVNVNPPFSADVYAANSVDARKNGATYYLMQNIFETLSKEQFTEFDFGRIPPSNHSTDNVYIFKNASRGKKVQYNGEWSFYKNKTLEVLMYFYKRHILKKQRY